MEVREVPLRLPWLHWPSPRCQTIKKSQAGAGVAVKIEHAVYQSAKMYGRHFEDKDEILSQITRQSIDVMKVHPELIDLWLLPAHSLPI